MTFTTEQAKRIIAACERETALRLKLWSPSRMDTAIRLSGVKGAALAVLDNLDGHEGFENAHGELMDELEAVDEHRLWEAMGAYDARPAESYVPPVGEAA